MDISGEVCWGGAECTPQGWRAWADGSVATLEEAVRFMAGGGAPNPYLSPKMKAADLEDDEISDLLACSLDLLSVDRDIR